MLMSRRGPEDEGRGMERELRLGDKIVVLDDRTGALDRTIDRERKRRLDVSIPPR